MTRRVYVIPGKTPLLTARLLGRANLLRTIEMETNNEKKPAAVPKTKRVMRRLTQHEYFKLCTWLQAATFTEGDTYVSIARRAEAELSLEINDQSLSAAMKALGLKLPRAAAPVDLSARVSELEADVGLLVEMLNYHLIASGDDKHGAAIIALMVKYGRGSP
jgi:hypothetical protein